MADFSDSIPRSSMGLEKSTISANWNNLSGNLKLTYYPEIHGKLAQSWQRISCSKHR